MGGNSTRDGAVYRLTYVKILSISSIKIVFNPSLGYLRKRI